MTSCAPATWCGRVNTSLPASPTLGTSSESLFDDPAERARYWLPEPPDSAFPALREFWEDMRKDITEYRCPEVVVGPKMVPFLPAPAPMPGPRPQSVGDVADVGADMTRFGRTSRESRSPNWSGAAVAAVEGNTLTQVVGSWVEPPFDKAGRHMQNNEFRSSIWIGFNGHAAHPDASLPQIGTLQRIAYENHQWVPTRWAWFEWWANTKSKDLQDYLKPVYLRLEVLEGDTVWCRVDLVSSGLVDVPYAARMCICVGRPGSKILVMPFLVYPPLVGRRRSQVMGSDANWIAELPMNIEKGPPFLLPQFGQSLNFAHCVAGSASDPGEPLVAEHTLEVSKRFHIFSNEPRGNPSLARIATSLTPRTSDTEFSIQVDGNDA